MQWSVTLLNLLKEARHLFRRKARYLRHLSAHTSSRLTATTSRIRTEVLCEKSLLFPFTTICSDVNPCQSNLAVQSSRTYSAVPNELNFSRRLLTSGYMQRCEPLLVGRLDLRPRFHQQLHALLLPEARHKVQRRPSVLINRIHIPSLVLQQGDGACKSIDL